MSTIGFKTDIDELFEYLLRHLQTLLLLVVLAFVVYQQFELKRMEERIDGIRLTVDDIKSSVDDIKSTVDDIQSTVDDIQLTVDNIQLTIH